jgi:hypothetical protein
MPGRPAFRPTPSPATPRSRSRAATSEAHLCRRLRVIQGEQHRDGQTDRHDADNSFTTDFTGSVMRGSTGTNGTANTAFAGYTGSYAGTVGAAGTGTMSSVSFSAAGPLRLNAATFAVMGSATAGKTRTARAEVRLLSRVPSSWTPSRSTTTNRSTQRRRRLQQLGPGALPSWPGRVWPGGTAPASSRRFGRCAGASVRCLSSTTTGREWYVLRPRCRRVDRYPPGASGCAGGQPPKDWLAPP